MTHNFYNITTLYKTLTEIRYKTIKSFLYVLVVSFGMSKKYRVGNLFVGKRYKNKIYSLTAHTIYQNNKTTVFQNKITIIADLLLKKEKYILNKEAV